MNWDTIYKIIQTLAVIIAAFTYYSNRRDKKKEESNKEKDEIKKEFNEIKAELQVIRTTLAVAAAGEKQNSLPEEIKELIRLLKNNQ